MAHHLPTDTDLRDRVLLAVMGSPDVRQIDGVGGAHPLTSKVAMIGPSENPEFDVDYLFLQVSPDTPIVSTKQNCGNILAGVGPFAIERGLVNPVDGTTVVRVNMVNSGNSAELIVCTPNGEVEYDGEASIDGVPGTHAPVIQNFLDTAGSQCGELLPSGRSVDLIDGIACTLIDNGMPAVIMPAAEFGLTGYETPIELEANSELKAKLESVRFQAGHLMNLGDVSRLTVPKMALVAPPQTGGMISTRSFIPHRVHESIGVLAAVSVATAALIDGTPAHAVATKPAGPPHRCDVEHPTGRLTVEIELDETKKAVQVKRSALLRTARKLSDGHVFIPHSVWNG